MLRFRRMHSLQKFASVHVSVHNHFNAERGLTSRDNYKQTRRRPRRVAAALRRVEPVHLPRRRRVRICLTAPLQCYGPLQPCREPRTPS